MYFHLGRRQIGQDRGMFTQVLGGAPCAVHALCPRCVKSRLFSTTGSHGSQGPEFCTLHPPCWYTRDFFVSVMLATGPRVLNSAPHAVLN